MKVLHRIDEIYPQIDFLRREGKSIGLVPTMGALHEGHYSLIRQSASQCDFTVASIFVNPSQFGPNEDLSRYPRSLDEDLDGLKKSGTDFVFVPKVEEVYREGFSTWVEPPKVSEKLEGDFRPGHYRGVATVVLKLFQIIPATIAFFGLKDYQQWLVIRQMVEDLNVPIRIEACPTIRESDGLAMSSRNRYLSIAERKRAVALSKALQHTLDRQAAGEHRVAVLEQEMRKILVEHDISQIDYVRIVDGDTLEAIDSLRPRCVALIAARVGNTRLIDNRLLM